MDWEVLSSNNGKWLHYVFYQEAPRGTCASRETGFICKRSGCRWKNGACADFVFVLICFDETFSWRVGEMQMSFSASCDEGRYKEQQSLENQFYSGWEGVKGLC